MPILHAFHSAKSEGSDPTVASANEWNADHNLSLPDSAGWVDPGRTVLSGADRLSLAGTARLTIQPESNTVLRGNYGLGTFQIVDGQWLLQYKHAQLLGNARATLSDNGELFIFDLAPVGRLVLAGSGGNF